MFDFELNLGAEKILVLFSGQLEGDDGEYGDEVDEILKRRNSSYKEVLFLCPEYMKDKILSFVNSDDRLISNLNRSRSPIQISFLTFDGYAELNNFYKDDNEKVSVSDEPRKLKEKIIKSGLLELVASRKDQVILKSPPGTVFQKPSGAQFDEFIKASELAVGFSENQFVAFALLAHRPKREDPRQIQQIWIDSSSISQYVESLTYYISKFNGDDDRAVQYHSFQSYGDPSSVDEIGYKAHVPDLMEDVWVIISASSSNNMGMDIFKVWSGIQHDQIVTLLSYEDTKYDQACLSHTDQDNPEYPAQPGDGVVVNISKFSESHSKEKKYGSEVPVKVIGENFTAQVDEPSQVILRKVHGPSEVLEFVEPNSQVDNIWVNKKKNNRLRSLFFDFVKFRSNDSVLRKDYLSWLGDIVEWYVPRSPGSVIYDFNDEASELLYQDLMRVMPESGLARFDINEDLNIDVGRPVITLLPVMTRGNSLVKLNSDLRLVGHLSQRVFVTPFALPHSKKEFDRFSRSLVLGPRGLKYQFFNFRKIFVGHQEQMNSWQRELSVVEQFASTLWKKRAELLGKQSKGILDSIGVSCNKDNEKLKFNVDFAFWTPGYKEEDVKHSAVYLTISAILQNLREKPSTLFDRDSLFTHVYQNSVLDPMNFSRFNDPLLQSCLWRCAYDGELDYRAPDDLSRKFIGIIQRLAKFRADGEPNATLDLLMGIAVRKIKISKDCLDELVASLTEILGEVSEFKEILEYISNEFMLENLNSDDTGALA